MTTSTAPAWVHQKALEVARRFTQDTEPQRRASLQIAVAEAMMFARPDLASTPQHVVEPVGAASEQANNLLAGFDAAVAIELPCVSTVEYNSHEICKWFAGNVRARLATQAATKAESPTLYVEVRECSSCGHVGINDDDGENAACNTCNWVGPSPEEDLCPGCNAEGTMSTACAKCGERSHLLASAELPRAARDAQTPPSVPSNLPEPAYRVFYSGSNQCVEWLGVTVEDGALLYPLMAPADSQGKEAPHG